MRGNSSFQQLFHYVVNNVIDYMLHQDITESQFIVNTIFVIIGYWWIFKLLWWATHCSKGLISRKHSRKYLELLYLRDRKCICDFSGIRVHHFGIISPSTRRCLPPLAHLAKESYSSVDPEDRNVFT